MHKSSKIFVAGGTGMVGSAIIRKLLSEGYTNIISNYNRRKVFAATPHPSPSPLIFVHLDLTRQTETEAFFEKERPEYVFLAAAKVGGIYANNTYPADFIYKNLMIQNCVLHSAYLYGVKKLLFLGSSCIYPKLAPQPMKEEYLLSGPLEPTNEPYAIAKIAGIKMCQAYNRQYGTNFISVMPTNLYGPNDNFDLETSHVLPALIRKFHLAKLLSGEKFDDIVKDFQRFGNAPDFLSDPRYFSGASVLSTAYSLIIDHLSNFGIKLSCSPSVLSPQSSVLSSQSSVLSPQPSAPCLHPPPSDNVVVSLWGTGEPYREFLHVDDLADACLFIMNLDEKALASAGAVASGLNPPTSIIINIGVGKDQKIREIAEKVKEVVEYKGAVEYDASKPDGTPRKLLDVTRLQNLGWSPRISLEEGMKNTYGWYCESSLR